MKVRISANVSLKSCMLKLNGKAMFKQVFSIKFCSDSVPGVLQSSLGRSAPTVGWLKNELKTYDLDRVWQQTFPPQIKHLLPEDSHI